ncbi:MAG: heavy-metal-associated domain-containing protein [Rhodospirillaceae bacterium]|jgi:copper chaperone|nr:heavy-metal-associated domain-containing protein [Rhodospirillaceae bacterium]
MAKTYLVGGMTCGGCVKSVTSAITAQYPSVGVEVELDGGKVQVDGDVEDIQIATLVEDAGFSYGGVA